MRSLLAFFERLEGSALSSSLRASEWMYPLVKRWTLKHGKSSCG